MSRIELNENWLFELFEDMILQLKEFEMKNHSLYLNKIEIMHFNQTYLKRLIHTLKIVPNFGENKSIPRSKETKSG